MQLLRRAKPTRDALVEALRASPVVYADGGLEAGRFGSGCGSSRTCARPSTKAGRLGAGEKLRGHPRGWAPYRCFKEATLQTCYNHLLHRCHGYWRRPRAGRCASHAWSPPARPRLASARCGEIRWPARCQGTPPGEDEPTADSPILPASRNICDAISSSTVRSRGHQLSRRTRHSRQHPRGKNSRREPTKSH